MKGGSVSKLGLRVKHWVNSCITVQLTQEWGKSLTAVQWCLNIPPTTVAKMHGD